MSEELPINEQCINFNFHNSLQQSETIDLLRKLREKSTKFEDETFPSEKVSLFGGKFPPGYNGEQEGIQWRSPKDISGQEVDLFGDMSGANICVGYLTDYYLLSAISILMAKDPEIIRRLFTVDKINDVGVYGVWLNINGGWQEITIDDKLPVFVDVQNHTIQYAFSQTYQSSTWLQLLEKAYAKVFGNYYSISAGDPLNCITELTGAPVERIQDFSNLNQVWSKLQKANNAGNIMLCTATPRMGVFGGTSGKPDVVVGHGYAIEDVFEEGGERYIVIRDSLE